MYPELLSETFRSVASAALAVRATSLIASLSVNPHSVRAIVNPSKPGTGTEPHNHQTERDGTPDHATVRITQRLPTRRPPPTKARFAGSGHAVSVKQIKAHRNHPHAAAMTIGGRQRHITLPSF